ncbi:MAG: hypothetical protein M3332_05030 [Actinomycetota bacterium]|nr:hypothetical protein [Actinomycetota bacterium]
MPDLAGVAGASLIREMWDLADVTTLGVRSDPERDPGVLADRIEARAEEFFGECAGRSANELRPWLVVGTTVHLSTLVERLRSALPEGEDRVLGRWNRPTRSGRVGGKLSRFW